MTNRENFGSKIGAVLAAAGSAVGLGNIWRFPIETGRNGGAAFIIIYIACILLIGLPVMLSEFMIGRHTQANTARAYQKLAPGTQWKWVGRLRYQHVDPDTGEEEEILIENTETRKQLENRQNALRLLRSQLYDRALKKKMAEQEKVEAGKKKIEWGSQIRSYVFDDRRVKDHRTNITY